MSAEGNRKGKRENQDTGQSQDRQTGKREHNEEDQAQRNQSHQRQGGKTGQNGGGANLPARTPRTRIEAGMYFDPHGTIRVGFLRLARNWKETGQLYQAMHAYMTILERYPGTGVADAAVEDLMELAETFEEEGRFHAALNLFNKIEELV